MAHVGPRPSEANPDTGDRRAGHLEVDRIFGPNALAGVRKWSTFPQAQRLSPKRFLQDAARIRDLSSSETAVAGRKAITGG